MRHEIVAKQTKKINLRTDKHDLARVTFNLIIYKFNMMMKISMIKKTVHLNSISMKTQFITIHKKMKQW